MSHEIDLSNDRANIAYVGDVPWHGLGSELQKGASIEEWQQAAGMNFVLKSYPATYFNNDTNCTHMVEGRRVLVRDDTQADLSIVSDDYKIVQPREVLEFYRDVVSQAGFDLDVAGVLKGGRKYWALAKLGQEAVIMKQDKIEGYLLLATSCDMSLASTAMFTSVRVVCNNTLNIAVKGEGAESHRYVKVTHNQVFNPAMVKAQLGLASTSWSAFIENANTLARRKVDRKTAVEWLVKVFGDAEKAVEEQEVSAARNMQRVLELFDGTGLGSGYASADGTAWGLVNAVTQHIDHHAGARTTANRLDRAWFGDGATVKDKAWEEALVLVEK